MKIGQYIASLGSQTRELIVSIYDLVYYMRGGLSYTECMWMSAAEREILADVINHRIKELKDSPKAVFSI